MNIINKPIYNFIIIKTWHKAQIKLEISVNSWSRMLIFACGSPPVPSKDYIKSASCTNFGSIENYNIIALLLILFNIFTSFSLRWCRSQWSRFPVCRGLVVPSSYFAEFPLPTQRFFSCSQTAQSLAVWLQSSAFYSFIRPLHPSPAQSSPSRASSQSSWSLPRTA